MAPHLFRIPGRAGLRTGVSRVSRGWGLFLILAATAMLIALVALFYNVGGVDPRNLSNPRTRRAE